VEYRPDNLFENRKFVIGGIAIAVVLLYIIQLFRLQILSPEYRAFADSNAFFVRLYIRQEVLFTTETENSLF